MGYLSNFIVYLLAMIGLIILALFVYKKFSVGGFASRRNNTLHVEDTLSLTPRKTLYVIKSGNERFLIAGDMERTTLISKLEEGSEPTVAEEQHHHVVNHTTRPIRRGAPTVDLSEAAIHAQDNVSPIRRPIMKEIKAKLNF